jgi:type I restriction enzyme S subunit
MKDSGVEWLGEVPEDWELKRVARLSRRTKIPASGLGIVTAFRDGQVTLRSNRRTAGFTEATEFHGYQRIRQGQVAVHKMDGFAGAIGVSDSDGMCSPVLTLLDCDSGLRPDYLALTLREISKTGWIEALAKGVRERTTEFGWSDLSWQVVPLPDIRQQEEIITYLDQETSQIDTLVEKTRRAIELLKERRQALITQVVTGKIDVRGFAGGNS